MSNSKLIGLPPMHPEVVETLADLAHGAGWYSIGSELMGCVIAGSPVVTDDMVDRACTVLTDDDWFEGTFPESAMRRALEAALGTNSGEAARDCRYCDNAGGYWVETGRLEDLGKPDAGRRSWVTCECCNGKSARPDGTADKAPDA